MGTVLLVGCSRGSKPNVESNPAAEAAAVEAAMGWLSMIDSGKYAESWDSAALYFRDAIPKEQWVQKIQATRKPLGATISREVGSQSYSTSLPGAPDGEYVVIQTTASFENKKSAVETITPMLDEDEIWRVSGYFIK
jgi:hypothetical protein